MAEKREEQDSPSPPPVIGAPVKPMSIGELMTWHANNGTLREFLERIEYDRDR